VTVLVVFYSRGGATEKLATAAAVGAVQGRAAIRVRRVPDADPDAIRGIGDSKESLDRMRREYVVPREADVLAADALILATPPDVDASAPEWEACLEQLARLRADGRLQGKVAAVVGSGPASESLSAVIRELEGVSVEPSREAGGDEVSRAMALGRRVAATAQQIKAGAAGGSASLSGADPSR
jgi:flavodoxin